MILGLIPLILVALYLGKRYDDMTDLIAEDEFPVVKVPTKRKSIRKVSLESLHWWLSRRTENQPLTIEQLSRDLERLQKSLKDSGELVEKG